MNLTSRFIRILLQKVRYLTNKNSKYIIYQPRICT